MPACRNSSYCSSKREIKNRVTNSVTAPTEQTSSSFLVASLMEFTVPQMPAELSESVVRYLSECIIVQRSSDADLQQLMEISLNFPRKFPISTMRCSNLLPKKYVKKNILEENANSCYPILHENALLLYIHFLEHKKKYGNSTENQVYANMGLLDLVQRMLEKRAVSFFGKKDKYLLLSGVSGVGQWEAIGTEKEENPLCLRDCLSYDEIKLSALLSVSSPSYFINDGKRNNKGIPNENPHSFTTHGVIIGLIGARLKKPGFMEWQDILVTKQQNVEKNGYGPTPKNISAQEKNEAMVLHSLRQLWANFYDIKPNLPLFDEVIKQRNARREVTLTQYTELSKQSLFDNITFKKRVIISIETLLIEAESRAAYIDKKAYVHMVGIGLGVWRASNHQETVFLEAFANCLCRLRPALQHISDINFSWFRESFQKSTWEDVMKSDEKGPGINIIFSKRSPHEKLSDPEDADKLLVVSYAWDGNALPGNEFWMKKLASTGDPAAACSSQVAELHNPHINKGKVSGANLHIASREWGVLHVSEYIKGKWPDLKSNSAKSSSAE